MDSINIIIILLSIIMAIYFYAERKYSYWSRRTVPYLQPQFFYGNGRELVNKKIGFGEFFTNIYNELKARGAKFGGAYLFFKPVFIPVDLDLVKTIMYTNFDNFRNHGMYVNEKFDPLSGHLFNLEDEKWKKLRAKLTPTFTPSKMKMMFHTMVSCTEGLQTVLRRMAAAADPIDIKDVISRFTTDVIGSVVFGIDCNSLENPDAEFRQFGRKIFEPTFVRRMKGFVSMLVPRHVLVAIGYKQTSSDIEEFFMRAVRDTIRYREDNNITRDDFMQLMLQLKNSGKITDDDGAAPKGGLPGGQFLTLNEVAAQCFVFFIAGFETSATTMTYALLELALNEDIQDRLREEIQQVLGEHEGEMTYEAVMKMEYLDKVIHEALRKHTPVPAMPRVCNRSFNIPGTDVVIEKGIKVQIPFHAIHKDPEHYPDPEKFDPERFSKENKAKRHQFAFLPFGEGPRMCIGARFGMMQAKVGLTAILSKFKVELHQKTKSPIKYSVNSFVSSVDGGVWLSLIPLH